MNSLCIGTTIYLKLTSCNKSLRFHLRWGCREVLYEKSPDGETYVKGLLLSKVRFLISVSVSALLSHAARSYMENMTNSVAWTILYIVLIFFLYIMIFLGNKQRDNQS